MEFEQKAEEKKMSMSKNIARLAVTAGLTAALSFGGVMAPVTMAFAAEGVPTVATERGKVLITDPDTEYADTSFKGIQIFTAKVTQNKNGNIWSGDKTLSDIQWANDNVKALVTTALKDVPEVPNVNDDDQTWAEFISTTQGSNYGETTAVDNGTVLDLIAEALEGDKALTWTQPSNSSKGNFESLDQGYWLFVTDAPSKTGNTDVYTSPIFTIVGGSDVEVAPKKSVPTVVKKIKNDDGGDWVDKADSQMGQQVKYMLTGTVASNIATFDNYYYEFSDKLSGGLTADDSSVVVKIGNTILPRNTTSGAKTGYDVSIDTTNTLTVKFTDLKAAAKQAGAALDGSSNVVVTYTAMLDPTKATNVTVGGTGNDNAVKLIYSNNPMGEGTGESVSDTVRDYTYALKLVKVDSVETAKKLKGVRFTIQATTPDGASSNGNYVQEKGNLGDTAYEFTTNGEGEISVKGLDAGTYTVHEVEGSNPGYNTLKDFNFTIEAEGLDKLEGEKLDDNTDPNMLKVTAGSNNPTMVTPAADGGTVTLTVKNEKGSNLPLTGLNGVTFTWIAGGAVLCIGVAHLIRSRKQAEESEQE